MNEQGGSLLSTPNATASFGSVRSWVAHVRDLMRVVAHTEPRHKRFHLVAVAVISLLTVAGCRKQQFDTASGATEPKFSTGHFNGAAFSIPKDEVLLFEYGEPAGGPFDEARPRDCTAPVRSAVVFLHWPDLAPVQSDSRADFERTRWKALGYRAWLDVGLRVMPKPDATLSPSPASVLNRQLEYRLDARRQVGILPPGVRLERGPDEVDGLAVVHPVGPGTEKLGIGNDHIYWHALASGEVTTLITGQAGRFDPPRWIPTCEQRFDLPALQAEVSVTYTQDLLSQWKTLQSEVARHLLAFKSPCTTRDGERRQ